MQNQARRDQFERLLRPCARACYHTAYRLTGSRADAEDLVQELFLKLYRQFDQWREMDDPTPWIRRVLYNLHIDLYRKKARTHGINERTLTDDEGALERQASDNPSPPEAAETRQQQERLRAALDRLDAEQRALVVLHLLEGHTLAEAAELLDTPVGTLKSRLHRCKAQLKKDLKLEPFSQK